MNRRVIYSLTLLVLGLMLGLVISRFFMPERYGIVTMLLLFLGGMVAGMLVLGAGLQIGRQRGIQSSPHAENSDARTQTAEPMRWAVALGARTVVIRTDAEWGAKFRARWFGDAETRARGWRGWWDAQWSDVNVPNAPLVFGALGMAVVAQLLIMGQLLWPGLGLYAAAGVVLVVWMWRQKISLFEIAEAARIGRRTEFLLVLVILLVAFGARIWQAGNIPFGIDGDELKWTAQVYYDFVAKEKTGDFAGQQAYTPVSFILDKIAFDIWGVDFNSPRVLAALLSMLATLVFYFIARDMFNPFVALLATLFMATSYFDVNTSRQAIVETFTKLPLLLALWLLMRGIDKQRWFFFLLAGVSLYAGIMTYDTFFVVPPALLLYLAFRGALDWRKWYRWLWYVALLIAPMLLAYPIVAETVRGRQYTYVKGVSAGLSDLVSQNTFAPIIENTTRAFTALFRALQDSDYALHWDGPLVNPLVLILFVLGFALVLARFWQRHNLLLLLTFVICFFPAPILSGYTMPRVFYIGLPPIFIFAGVAFACITAALFKLASRRVALTRAVTVGVIAVLAVIALSDGFILTQKLEQQADWLKRRYFVNTIKSSVQSAPLTLLPMTRTPDDFIWGNHGVLKFVAYSAARDKAVSERYKAMTFEELPGALGALADSVKHVNIVYDKALGEKHPIVQATMDTLKRCYGNVKTRSGSFFDTYILEGDALRASNCYSLTDLAGVAPSPDELVAANQPITFEWEAGSDRPTAHRIEIEQRNPKLVWVEGENFPRTNGWMFEAKIDHYPDFSGEGYLLDDVRSQPTQVNVEIPDAAKYQVWVRSLRGGKGGHRNFISVGGQNFEFSRAEDAPYLQWSWEMVGQVDLDAGETALELSREYGKEGWKPVLVDAVFLSADPEFNPEASALWTPLFDSGEIASRTSEFVFDKGLDPGAYRWRVQLLDGDKLVDASGEKGIWSDKLDFQVQ